MLAALLSLVSLAASSPEIRKSGVPVLEKRWPLAYASQPPSQGLVRATAIAKGRAAPKRRPLVTECDPRAFGFDIHIFEGLC